MNLTPEMIEAAAYKMAEMEGSGQRFLDDKAGKLSDIDGTYEGYLAEAAETLKAAFSAMPKPITLTYTNWRGETAERTIIPHSVWYGSTEWHPDPQWLLKATDTEKGAERDFALKDFGPTTPAPQPVVVPDELSGIPEVIDEGGGIWRTCSGCYEVFEGYPVGKYPYSKTMRCNLGSGCRECGGIGAIWDTTDYEDFGRYLATEAAVPPAPQPVVVKPLEWRSEPVPPAGEILASSVVGLYCIRLGHAGRFYVWFRDQIALGNFDTLEAAKTAAQAHLETLVLSALTTRLDDIDRLREENERLRAESCFQKCSRAEVAEGRVKVLEEARKTYQANIEAINRATDKEIDAAMAEIHARQLDRDRIKPGRNKYDPGVDALLRKIRGDGGPK